LKMPKATAQRSRKFLTPLNTIINQKVNFQIFSNNQLNLMCFVKMTFSIFSWQNRRKPKNILYIFIRCVLVEDIIWCFLDIDFTYCKFTSMVLSTNFVLIYQMAPITGQNSPPSCQLSSSSSHYPHPSFSTDVRSHILLLFLPLSQHHILI
jgi:hypothetical protein